MISLPRGPRRGRFAQLQRRLMAPVAAAVSVAACGLAFVLAGGTGKTLVFTLAVFAATTVVGALAAGLTGAPPIVPVAATVALAATGTCGFLLWRMADVTPALTEAGLHRVLPVYLPLLLVVSMVAAGCGLWLRGKLN